MTADEPVVDTRQQIAEELMLLGMLKDRVAAEIDKRRKIGETWPGGTLVPVELPNPDNPARPIPVGKIQAQGGQGVARVANPHAWTAWCLEHYPHNVIRQEESRTSWAIDAKSREALTEAYDRAKLADDGSFTYDPSNVLLRALEDAGYTLTRTQIIPAQTVVSPAWETETLKLTQKAGMPVCPGGEVPDGIDFDPPEKAPVRLVVTVGKDERTRERFVGEYRHRLLEITGDTAGGDA